ncbi:MAG TPA: hypothetical protein PLQ97_13390 [Myxococcota bacterium]|nr:hypothetical protein [Myxococcota bacterium]HQK52143.1 hypothetical protein [Myxococcota bacterium]
MSRYTTGLWIVAIWACGGANPSSSGDVWLPRSDSGSARDASQGTDPGRDPTLAEETVFPDSGVPEDTSLGEESPGQPDPGPRDSGIGTDGGTDRGPLPDPGTTDDPWVPTDLGPQDGVGGCDPCGMGTIAGVTCAPNLRNAVPYVKVWVDTTDCNGMPHHYQTYSDAQGNFSLEVPCGTQTVWMEKNSYRNSFTRWVDKGLTTTIRPADGCFPSTAAKIAIVTGDWDDIGLIVGTHLRLKHTDFDGITGGQGFTTAGAEEAVRFLTDLGRMSEFDIIFLNCSDSSSAIMDQYGVEVRKNLEDFVRAGGSIYASDYAFSYLEGTWVSAMNFPNDPYLVGGHQTVTATVTDPDLAAFLKKGTVSINFDLGPIVAVDSAGPGSIVHIQAMVKELGKVAPLMISFEPYPPDGGRVAFTNFHNARQLDVGSDITSILEYVVFLM